MLDVEGMRDVVASAGAGGHHRRSRYVDGLDLGVVVLRQRRHREPDRSRGYSSGKLVAMLILSVEHASAIARRLDADQQ